MLIPIVFWLVLTADDIYAGPAPTVLPVPFSTLEDCEIAGKQYDASSSNHYHVCIQQRQDDVVTFQNWSSASDGTYNR